MKHSMHLMDLSVSFCKGRHIDTYDAGPKTDRSIFSTKVTERGSQIRANCNSRIFFCLASANVNPSSLLLSKQSYDSAMKPLLSSMLESGMCSSSPFKPSSKSSEESSIRMRIVSVPRGKYSYSQSPESDASRSRKPSCLVYSWVVVRWLPLIPGLKTSPI